MKSIEFLTESYKIRKVERDRPDDSVEVKYEVLDSNGVTRKIFLDRKTAESWARDNWMDL